MIVVIPVLVAIVGLLLYALTNGKASEIGRIMFAVGLLVALLGAGHPAIRLL